MARKSGKEKPIYKGITFDSTAEVDFYYFLEDLKKAKLIKDFTYQPESYVIFPKKTKKVEVQLKTKTKIVEKTLYKEHKYTADYLIKIDPSKYSLIDPDHILTVNDDNTILVDIKGSYNDFGGDRIYKIHEKAIYHFYGLHLNKVVPEEYFGMIHIAPERIRWMKCRKTPTLKTAYRNTMSVEEFVKTKPNTTKTQINIPGMPCM